MRYAGLTLSLLVLAASACKSSGKSEQDESAQQPGGAASGEGGQAAQKPLDLETSWENLSAQEQKKVLLVDQHVQRADELTQQVRLEEAESELLAALALDPDNLAVKQKLANVGALLGRPSGQTAAAVQDLGTEHQLKVQQLRLDAEDSLGRGKLMLERGDYDAAIAELTICLDTIRWAPYSLDWGGIDAQATELLERAKSERASAADKDRSAAEQKALAELRADEQRADAQRRAAVDNMLEQAIAAFDAADYDAAMDFAEQAMEIDPRNERAAEIRDSAFRAGRKKVHEDVLELKKERFARWLQEMAELRVPYTSVVTPPDEAYWNRITDLRAQRTGIASLGEISEFDRALLDKLKETRVPGLVIEDEESLQAVIGTVRTITALPLVVDPKAEQAATEAGVVFAFNIQNPLSVDKLLNLIVAAAGDQVTWTIRHDVVLVTTKDKALGELVIMNHDVQDLTFKLTQFLGPRIDRIRLIDENEDDDGGGPFGGLGEKRAIIEPDELANLVRENVAVGTWEQEGVSLSVEIGNMIVRHRPEVQREVRQFLEDLRLFSSSMVTIESKFLTVEENWLQEIGVDFKGLDNPGVPFTDLDDVTNGLEDNASLGLDNGGTGVFNANAAGSPSAGFFYDDGQDGDFKGHTEHIFGEALGSALSNVGGLTTQLTFLNDLQISAILRAVEKSSNIELVNDQVVSVFNTQRAFVSVINQQAYVQDFDVEVATLQSIADPVINVLTEGIVLDVRPTIHQDRKYLTLEIQPTVAEIIALSDFQTSLGGPTSPVTFQLPELEVKSVRTTAVVPDGGSILIGGLSRVRNIERRAEVPWLANVPIVGFFFKEEGYNDEKSGLMIMLRAWITDVKESVAQAERR